MKFQMNAIVIIAMLITNNNDTGLKLIFPIIVCVNIFVFNPENVFKTYYVSSFHHLFTIE